MRVSAIIVAAGNSRRMGFDKLAADLRGESVLTRSMLALAACEEVAEIRMVTSPEKFEAVEEAATRLGIAQFVEVIAGGAERHLSVAAGLARIGDDCDLVAVHDAARPLVSRAAITRCLAAAHQYGAATLAHRIADTLKRGDAAGEVVDAVSRDDLWAMETPQIFRVALLREAYAEVLAKGEPVTDEVSAVRGIGHIVKLVENSEPNLKITVPGDLVVAAAIWGARE
ncbi:MAG: 2-C-methyl-D-erythritol 4-phosphate cytidylyltransferase [Verrucomicrobiaceae bacterium]|nr:2-C-methyl-D-erythritol 4-phosphate cytidylyltransferase [Verrucomicrobiaceae bacterium]